MNHDVAEEEILASTTEVSKKNIGHGLEKAVGAEVNVYVGVDVFGRNFYEGGGFNTDKVCVHLMSSSTMSRTYSYILKVHACQIAVPKICYYNI